MNDNMTNLYWPEDRQDTLVAEAKEAGAAPLVADIDPIELGGTADKPAPKTLPVEMLWVAHGRTRVRVEGDLDEAIAFLMEEKASRQRLQPPATPRGLTMVAGGGFQFGLAQWQRD